MTVEQLNDLLNRFESSARPTNADSSAPATVGDINKLINAISKLMSVLNANDQLSDY